MGRTRKTKAKPPPYIPSGINHTSIAVTIGNMKTHAERMEHMKDLNEGHVNLCYLLSMQMGLPKTIARLPSREERKQAWEELPDNSCKSLVKFRVIQIFKRR
jgi:hypothetical protein